MASSIFKNIAVFKPRRSVFDLSYENKLSFDMGQLVPVYVEEVVPGDKFRVNTEVFLRFAPMIFPVMHRINCYVHYFFVPYRLIYEDFQDFITGGEDGLSTPAWPRYALPPTQLTDKNLRDLVINFSDSNVGTLADFLGYTLTDYYSGVPTMEEFSLHRFRAYQFIYNEYYRDQNLTPEVQFSKASGTGASENLPQLLKGTDYESASAALQALMTLRYRAWEKDYFTSALPFVQRGVASQVPINLDLSNLRTTFATGVNSFNTNQSVIDKAFDKSNPSATLPGDDVYIRTDGTISTGDTTELTFGSSAAANGSHSHSIAKSSFENSIRIVENEKGVTITPPTINELRLAEHIQRWLEKNARGGARYVEQILSHFGVRVPDYRLDRPEYLGGGKSPVQISEVLQTSSTDATSPQGSMAGHGYSVGNKNQFKYTFEEHGTVIGIMSVLPRTGYMQGISRALTKFDKFDHYFPEFAHLGEQAVYNREVYNDQSFGGNPAGEFGYQERYAEYKFRNDEVHGDFKTSLDSWHMARKFQSLPELNTSFVQSQPTNRIFAVEDGNHMWCQVYNKVTAVRPMPKHAIPSI